MESLYEKLFVLQHIAYGSMSHCRSVKVIVEDAYYDREFDKNYKIAWARTKTIVSNYLIECAIKLRMIQEFCAKHVEPGYLDALERRAMNEVSLGEVSEGSFRLTIREACNKIIHATSASIDFEASASEIPAVLFWNGRCVLGGNHGSLPWKLHLDVANWARAATCYVELLDEDEQLCYLGQNYS